LFVHVILKANINEVSQDGLFISGYYCMAHNSQSEIKKINFSFAAVGSIQLHINQARR